MTVFISLTQCGIVMAVYSRARSLCEAISKIISEPSFVKRVSNKKKVGPAKKRRKTGGGKKKRKSPVGKKRKGKKPSAKKSVAVG